MTAQSPHFVEELIPRPEKTPRALHAALAAVAPHRLAEMEEHKNDAIALAVSTRSLTALEAFLNTWASHVEIARNVETAARLREAERAVQVLDRDDPRWSEAVRECREIFRTAYAAVS